FSRYDVVLVLDPGNAPLVIPLRALGRRLVIHADGLGWKRRKWGVVARRYYKWAERMSVRIADVVISDSRAIQAYYADEYGAQTAFIPYGCRSGHLDGAEVLRGFGLERRGYWLVVSRLEPENNTDVLIDGYRQAGLTRPLVIVGGVRYRSEFAKRI